MSLRPFRPLAAALLCLMAGTAASAAEPSAPAGSPSVGPVVDSTPRTLRVFKLVHRTPAEAFALVQPLLSAEGSVTISPKVSSMTVRDAEPHLSRIGEAIRQFDVARRAWRLKVSLLRASEQPVADAPRSGPARLRGIGARLAGLLKYSQYEPIDEIVVTGEEGGVVAARMAGDYAVDFTLDAPMSAGPGSSSAIRLRAFQLSRVKKDERGDEQLTRVFRTTVNLQPEKPFVLGATRDEQSRTALLIVLLATPAE